MALTFCFARGNRGGSFAAGPAAPVAAAGYDEDAQSYFTALEAASGWSEPDDYSDKKDAISDYVAACKTAGKWEKIKALYIPIWQVAAPNALSAKRTEEGSDVTTYDLTWRGTGTHDGGDYVVGDGSSGWGEGPFEGPAGSPTFLSGVTDFSCSGNVLGAAALTTYDCLMGWYYEAAIYPTQNTTSNVGVYTWKYNNSSVVASSGTTAFWAIHSDTPTGANTHKFALYKNGSSHTTKEGTTSHSYSNKPWGMLCANWGDSGTSSQAHHSQYHVNFIHVGLAMASASDFNSDTATLLDAL